jgi:hypothetical protein
MPIINAGSQANAIDAQAVSGDRQRRNWQRMAKGGVNSLIALNPDGGLTNEGGLGILLDPNGALIIDVAGLAVRVDGSTIVILDDVLQIGPGIPTFQQVMGRISIGI